MGVCISISLLNRKSESREILISKMMKKVHSHVQYFYTFYGCVLSPCRRLIFVCWELLIYLCTWSCHFNVTRGAVFIIFGVNYRMNFFWIQVWNFGPHLKAFFLYLVCFCCHCANWNWANEVASNLQSVTFKKYYYIV